MPTYEYQCAACGHELELFQNISEAPKKKCPACKKSRLKRKIGGGAGFLFKGSGFYLTDYRSDSYKKGADKDPKPSGDGAEAKSGNKDAPKKDPAGEKPAGATSPKEKPAGKKGKGPGKEA